MAVSGWVLLKELRKIAEATGSKFDLARTDQYLADVQVMSVETFMAACREIRSSWHRSYFPPVGAIVEKGSQISCQGQPNAPRPLPMKGKGHVSDEVKEAVRRHDDLVVMNDEEYMEVMRRAGKDILRQ